MLTAVKCSNNINNITYTYLITFDTSLLVQSNTIASQQHIFLNKTDSISKWPQLISIATNRDGVHVCTSRKIAVILKTTKSQRWHWLRLHISWNTMSLYFKLWWFNGSKLKEWKGRKINGKKNYSKSVPHTVIRPKRNFGFDANISLFNKICRKQTIEVKQNRKSRTKLKMALNNSSQNGNEKRASRERKQFHLDVISKSVGRIIGNSSNAAFQSEINNMLNIRMSRRKKNIQTETMKLLKANYDTSSQRESTQNIDQ